MKKRTPVIKGTQSITHLFSKLFNNCFVIQDRPDRGRADSREAEDQGHLRRSGWNLQTDDVDLNVVLTWLQKRRLLQSSFKQKNEEIYLYGHVPCLLCVFVSAYQYSVYAVRLCIYGNNSIQELSLYYYCIRVLYDLIVVIKKIPKRWIFPPIITVFLTGPTKT